MKQQAHIITLTVENLDRALAFYRDGLGWQAWWPAPDDAGPFDHASFELQKGLSLVLYPRTSLARDIGLATLPAPPSVCLTLYVDGRKEADGVVEQALAAGAKEAGRAESHPKAYMRRFTDPDGHLWEVMWNPKAGIKE